MAKTEKQLNHLAYIAPERFSPKTSIPTSLSSIKTWNHKAAPKPLIVSTKDARSVLFASSSVSLWLLLR
jgi:hypothetical protein